jgi:hypothetical protein
MKFFLLLFCYISLFSCKNDDEPEIDCALYDPFIRSLFIKLIDSEGQNLIENNTYMADDITVLFNGYTYTNVVFNDVQGIENLITLSVIGIDGDNTLKIKLSEEITDTLILNLTADSQVCGWTFFTLNSATYNGVLQQLEDFNGNHLITVLK